MAKISRSVTVIVLTRAIAAVISTACLGKLFFWKMDKERNMESRCIECVHNLKQERQPAKSSLAECILNATEFY